MTSKSLPTQSASGGDLVKYALALLLAAAGVFAFYWFDGQWPTGVRILAVVAGLAVGAFVFLATAKGAETREFLSEARFELRKVVWPTRQETTRTMWVVIAVVILMSLMLAGMDLVIQAAVKWVLGNG
ncbi:MAG: preprotein translocase subunit SecE [Alphaproteobacteria bacterium]|nr:MAG: preprotein translocase subunit SecE [Alphaproteobacteria bacterium]